MMNKTKRISFFHTSDTHGYLNEISYQTGKTVDYGLSRVASYVKRERTINTILIDTGDTIQGSPLMYFYKSNFEKYNNPVAEVMNNMNYDYLVPGNHDFNYGREFFSDFIENSNANFLCGNILKDDKPLVGKEYEIIEFEEGLKVAVIGITTNFIPIWEKKEHIDDLVFINAFEKTKEIVNKIKIDPSIKLIVLGYHGGFERDLDSYEIESMSTENLGMKIFLEIPEIDIILSGHQHRIINKSVNGRILMQPGANAKFLSRVDIDFEFDNEWNKKEIKSSLIDCGTEIPDPEITSKLSKIIFDNNIFLDEIIGVNKDNDLEITNQLDARLNKHKIVDLINTIQLESSGAQISCMALGNSSTGFKEEISIRDVLNTYVYPNTLAVVEIDGVNLRAALEKNANFFVIQDNEVKINPAYKAPKLEYYNYDMFSGIDYTIDLKNDFGNRITKLEYNGQQINDSDKFSLVMSSYRFSGGGEFYMYEGLKVIKEIPLDISELIIDYIKKTKEIKVREEKNNIVKY